MNFIFILLAVLIFAATVAAILMKKGILKDEDGDQIPDVLEDAYADAKEKAEDLLEEAKDLPKKLTRKKPGRSKTKKKTSTETVKPAPVKKTAPKKTEPSISLTESDSNGDYYRKPRKANK